MKKLVAHKTIQESLLFFVFSLSLLTYSLCGQYGGSAIPWKLSPYLFPALVSLLMLLLSASLFWDGLRELRAGRATEAPKDKPNLRGVLIVTALTVLYCSLMPFVGFLVSTVIFLSGLLWYLGERKLPLIAAVAVGCAGLCYLIFDLLLRVMLP